MSTPEDPKSTVLGTDGNAVPAGVGTGHGVLTAEEACSYLRLDEGRSMSAAIHSLNHLVRKRAIHPCVVGKHRRYARAELDRFIQDQTFNYPPPKET